MAKCIGCPAGKQLDADEAVANVLGLATGPNYKSELGTIMQGWKKLKGGTGNNFDCLGRTKKKVRKSRHFAKKLHKCLYFYKKKHVNRDILPKNA